MGPRRGSRAVAHCGIAVAISALAWGVVGCGADPRDAEPGVVATGVATTGVVEPVASAENGSSATTAPQAFVFESGVLEIGDFDPYTLGDNIFDPCTEITPEEFAAAGFDRVEPLPEEYAGLARGSSACEVIDSEGFIIGTFLNNNADKATVKAQANVRDSVAEPAIFYYQPANTLSAGCFAQIDTVRGGLSVSVVKRPHSGDSGEACDTAVAMLHKLLIRHSR